MSEDRNDRRPAIVRDWWAAQMADDAPRLDLGLRARLRRTEDLVEAIANPAFALLCRMTRTTAQDADRILVLARALALVRSDTAQQEQSLGRAMARPRGSGTTVPEARLRTLMRLAAPEDDPMALVRTVELLDGKLPVADFAGVVLSWEHRLTKRKLVFDYFGVADPPPSDAAVPARSPSV
jgi:CRISPR type I-E-associated protein CasB/Cse2